MIIPQRPRALTTQRILLLLPNLSHSSQNSKQAKKSKALRQTNQKRHPVHQTLHPIRLSLNRTKPMRSFVMKTIIPQEVTKVNLIRIPSKMTQNPMRPRR